MPDATTSSNETPLTSSAETESLPVPETAPAPIDPQIDLEPDHELHQQHDEADQEPVAEPEAVSEPALIESGPIIEPAPSVEPGAEADAEPHIAPISGPIIDQIIDPPGTQQISAVTASPEPEPDTKPPASVEPEESFADIFSEFQRTQSRREPGAGSQIRGTVVAITTDSVLVDIGYKSEGILPLTALPANRPPVQPGDALLVSVKGRDADGYYELSLFRTAQPKDWTSLQRAFDEKSTIVGTVSAVVKGGLHVDVGVRAFMPASRSGTRDAQELEKLVGQEVRCRITKLDVDDEDVVVDRRAVLEEEALEARSRRYAEVAEGAIVNGTVRSITDYGAFVDLGGVDGLLHISDIAWSRVANVADVLTVGQQIEAKVLKIDLESRRIALGLKQLLPHPWDSVEEKYKAGDRVRGVVTRTTDFGAFVELEPGVEGLVHISEMSWSKRVHKATEIMNAGDIVEALILAISPAEHRISLGLKQALGDPWVDASSRFAPGSIIEGPVASLTKFGAFIQVAEGIQGLVHISEIVPDRRLNHPSDVLHAGQRVRALVLDVDKEKRQVRLSIKQLIPTGLDDFLADHKIGDIVIGRVASIENGIAQVELGEGIVCPTKLPADLPKPAQAPEPQPSAAAVKVDLSAFSSMLKTKWKTGSASAGPAKQAGTSPDAIKQGQLRSFRIIALDAQAKQITLELVP